MRNIDTFSSFHPIVNFLYYGLVMGFSMFFMHPVCLAVSFASALAYNIYLDRERSVKFSLLFIFPVILMAAILNPAFNHEGVTILTYLPSGNVLTLESIAYGIGAATMLASIIIWFSNYSKTMTSDKFVYLFGRIIPALSLVLSMTLRFVPKFKEQFSAVREAQQCIGRDISNGSIFFRAKNLVTIFSVMVTWSMENAIETADSMKSRGYGLEGRTAFSIYHFDRRDKAALLWLGFCGVFIFSGACYGGLFFRYYPSIKGVTAEPFSVALMAVYFALCITPVTVNIKEDSKWKSLKSET